MARSGDPRHHATASAIAADLRATVGTLKRRLRDQGLMGDLTPSQASALARLEWGGPCTTSALARAEGVRPQSMGTIVAALSAAGYVAGTPDPADGRQTVLALTPAGRDWIDAGRAARQDWLTRVIDRELTPDERHELARAMILLRRIADA